MATDTKARPAGEALATSEPAAQRYLPHVAFAVLVFGSWELYGQFVNPLSLPPVSAILIALVEITFDGTLLSALAESLQLLGVGFATAFGVSFVVGVLVGRYRLLDRTFSPFLRALYATPDVALIPVILVWFGFGMPGRVVVVFLAAFFPMLINVYAGVRNAPEDLIEVARTFGYRSELALLTRVVLPAAMPLIMAGVRLGIGRAVVGMALAEVYLRLSGIGALIVGYGNTFQTAYLFAAILPLPLLGIGLTKLVGYLESRMAMAKSV
jgi:ABC-type nitrate/sulfonate/bicarbonate transport system permease component